MAFYSHASVPTKVKLLGDGNSYDIKAMFPKEYYKLTNDNFFLTYNGLSMSGWSGGLPGDGTSAQVDVTINTVEPSFDYDKTTGILTITPGSISAYSTVTGGSHAGSHSSTHTGTVGHKAYVVIGKIN